MAERLSRRQKRELGILPIQVLPRARELAKEGLIDDTMSNTEIAFVYAIEVSCDEEFQGAWNQVHEGSYGADWDSIIEFLEKLFELLMKFLPLFI